MPLLWVVGFFSSDKARSSLGVTGFTNGGRGTASNRRNIRLLLRRGETSMRTLSRTTYTELRTYLPIQRTKWFAGISALTIAVTVLGASASSATTSAAHHKVSAKKTILSAYRQTILRKMSKGFHQRVRRRNGVGNGNKTSDRIGRWIGRFRQPERQLDLFVAHHRHFQCALDQPAALSPTSIQRERASFHPVNHG